MQQVLSLMQRIIMIDNSILAQQLVSKIEMRLPMQVMPTKELQKILADRKIVVLKGYF
jgi:hypothetical protein